MATKNVTIRLNESMSDYILKTYINYNVGINEALDALRTIRAYSLNELKGKFTKEEWSFFADSALVAHCEDSELLEGTARKWGVGIKALIEKVNSLTGAQVEALYLRVEQFWNDESRDLDKFKSW